MASRRSAASFARIGSTSADRDLGHERGAVGVDGVGLLARPRQRRRSSVVPRQPGGGDPSHEPG
jgi:hypothetical protein